MHRIDSFGATQDNRFTEGDPVVPVPPTQVSADWLNAVQEEISHVVEGAGVSLDKQNNSQLLAAVNALVQAGTLVPGAPGTWLHVDEAGNIVWQSLPPVEKYDITQTLDYFLAWHVFKGLHPTANPGMVPVNGVLLQNASETYPKAFDYLQTTHGQMMCVTEAVWQAAHQAMWATLADGTQIGWNNIGGCGRYVVDPVANTIRVPDLRGMYEEVAGYDSLGVGGVHGDGVRNITGKVAALDNAMTHPNNVVKTDGAFKYAVGSESYGYQEYSSSGDQVYFDASRVVPTAAKNQPRAWGALACVYLGLPAS